MIYGLTRSPAVPVTPRSRRSCGEEVIGLVILPWNLYNSSLVIVYFLGGLGALLALVPRFTYISGFSWFLVRFRPPSAT